VAIKTEKRHEIEKKPNAIKRWWRETLGELRKVSWPTLPEARRLTKIVLIVMGIMALLLGVLDYLFSTLITLILT
jgi:preprotein translocase subunit SecE